MAAAVELLRLETPMVKDTEEMVYQVQLQGHLLLEAAEAVEEDLHNLEELVVAEMVLLKHKTELQTLAVEAVEVLLLTTRI
jgi:hypothetical protein